MKITVASGKGGTGKTLVAANLGFSLAEERDVTIVDCDVEEPNLHLFFEGEAEAIPVTAPVPVVNEEECTHCGKCSNFCRFGALTVMPERVLLFEDLCHSCGGCVFICPEDAITEKEREIGHIDISHPVERLTLISGVLREGEVLAPRVIRKAKDMAEGADLAILDASPGIACPVMETLKGSDACIMVTEPTPFGLHDLRLAAEVVSILGIPSGVVINRSDGRDRMIRDFCAEHNIPVLLTIPFSRDIARIQNTGGLIARDLPEWHEEFSALYGKVLDLPGVGH
ncbi:MAG: ATP-binding protein [Methanoculleaceae archaeon]